MGKLDRLDISYTCIYNNEMCIVIALRLLYIFGQTVHYYHVIYTFKQVNYFANLTTLVSILTSDLRRDKKVSKHISDSN